MAVMFPRLTQVIRREPGQYVDGNWIPPGEVELSEIPLSIQPASQSDYMRTQATLSGRRVTAMMRVYANLDANLRVAGYNEHPGDLVIYNGDRWLVIGSTRWDALNDADTSHCRYMIVLESEHAKGEVML